MTCENSIGPDPAEGGITKLNIASASWITCSQVTENFRPEHATYTQDALLRSVRARAPLGLYAMTPVCFWRNGRYCLFNSALMSISVMAYLLRTSSNPLIKRSDRAVQAATLHPP